jgi:hypothetical protein
MQSSEGWWGDVGMVLVWVVWMFGSAVHYTILPRCLSRSFLGIVGMSILQAALTGMVSWLKIRVSRRYQKRNRQAGEAGDHLPATTDATLSQDRTNVLIAGTAFAVAITMTNASVAYGSISGSRMVKSLEPAVVLALQLVAGIKLNHRADFPWVFLLAVAVIMLLTVAPTGITFLSATTALLSTAGISTRNVFVKKQMLATHGRVAASASASAATVAEETTQALTSLNKPASPTPQDVQTHLNFVACAILILVTSAWIALLGWDDVQIALRNHITISDVLTATTSFACFQVAALKVLESVSPTRQAAIKSLQNALTTAWALLIETKGFRHSSLEIVPAIVWGICVFALASDAQMSFASLGAAAERRCLPNWALGKQAWFRKNSINDARRPERVAAKKEAGAEVRIDTEQANSGRTDRVQIPETRRSAWIMARVWALVYCASLIAMLVQCMIAIARRPWFITRRIRTYANAIQ